MAMTKAEVADAVCAWCTAWHTQDIPTILAMDARAGGFGFRPRAWRDHVARGEAQDRQALERFFGQKVYYRLEPEDFQTSIEGAWCGVGNIP
jgi:hypothetical protein